MAGNKVYNEKLSRLKTAAVKYRLSIDETTEHMKHHDDVPDSHESIEGELHDAAIEFATLPTNTSFLKENEARDQAHGSEGHRRELAQFILRTLTSSPGRKDKLAAELHNLSRPALEELKNALAHLAYPCCEKRKIRQGRMV